MIQTLSPWYLSPWYLHHIRRRGTYHRGTLVKLSPWNLYHFCRRGTYHSGTLVQLSPRYIFRICRQFAIHKTQFPNMQFTHQRMLLSLVPGSDHNTVSAFMLRGHTPPGA